jgi:hypothetical protein
MKLAGGVPVSGMYRLAQPHEFDKYSVAALLAVGNTADLQKLLALAPVQRNVLLSLPADTLQTLVADNSITELAVLANRMLEPAQSPTAVGKIAEDVAQGNVTIAELTTPTGTAAAGATVAVNTGDTSQSSAPPQAAPGLQQASESGNIIVLGILATLAILVAAAAVAIGYLQRRKTRGV